MTWTDYSSAPAPGTAVCKRDGLKDVQAITVTTERGDFPLLVVINDDAVLAYVNACPHQYLPLTYRGDQVLSADGTMLMCTAHGACFDKATGAAIRGADCALDAVPLRIVGNVVQIDG